MLGMNIVEGRWDVDWLAGQGDVQQGVGWFGFRWVKFPNNYGLVRFGLVKAVVEEL